MCNIPVDVMKISIFLEIDGVVYRLALIGYSRRAIREYYKRKKKPEAKLIGIVKGMLETLPASRVGWIKSVKMINGIVPTNVQTELGEAEFQYFHVKCHMNMYLYLSAWIHYASLLITKFSLSYKETVGLVIGMYCESNPICFVLVAKELLAGTDTTTGVSSTNFGLMIRLRMGERKAAIRSQYSQFGFTFPRRFQNCWQDRWQQRMNSTTEFENEKNKVSNMCALYME
jgi:hypothetical protein